MALKLHEESLVVDMHADIPWDICNRRTRGETQILSEHHLSKLRGGGIDAAIFAVCIEDRFKLDRALRRGLQFVEGVHEELSQTKEFVMATSVSDILKAKEGGKIAVILGVEGGEVIEQDLRLLRIFHTLGVRSFGLTWSQRNMIADGAWEKRTGGGLSNFGVKVVKECNRLGILVDLAHISEPGFWDVLKVSEEPVIVSHTSVESLCGRGVGLSGSQIRAIAKNGGLVGICAVTTADADPPGTIDLVVNQMEYIRDLVGIDYVGYGPDYYDYLFPILKEDMPQAKYVLMPGLEDARKTPNLTKKLLKRKFSSDEIRKILGENFLRVFRKVVG